MEDFELQTVLPGRDASPCFEKTVRIAVESAFKSLFETKNLYQKVDVDLSNLESALLAEGVDLSSDGIAPFKNEAHLRPWFVVTHHQGDDPTTASVMSSVRGIGQPLGIAVEEMYLNFLVPSVRLSCPKCKDKTTFEALCTSRQSGFSSPYPRTREGVVEQVFLFFYRCVSCREFIHTALTYRKDLRLQLCGFAPRRQLPTKIKIDSALQPIANDAHNATQEGDVFAGFYHLRTLVEHYIKIRLDIPIESQIRGDQLTEQYNASLPDKLKSAIPSLTPAYEELSRFLHSRSGTTSDFARIEEAINDHLEALKLLGRYHTMGG